MMAEPNAGGRYQFVEPQQECWVPIGGGYEVSAALLAEAGYAGVRFIVPARGRGEVFIPRTLNPERTAQIYQTARDWYDEGD
jgi:hypothetical protein